MFKAKDQGLKPQDQGQVEGLIVQDKSRQGPRTRLSMPRTKDWRFKAKARTKDSGFVLKDDQGPKTKAKDNIAGFFSASSVFLVL